MEISVGLFEQLCIADSERIHSQVISWMLSQDSPLSNHEKAIFLCSLLGLEKKPYHSIDSLTEFRGIDILIRADNDLYVIENKLKSSQHSDQLAKYQSILKTDTSGFWMLEGAADPKFYFLTLIGELAASDGWINIDYHHLLEAVQKASNSTQDSSLHAYLTSLENLMAVVDAFNEDHRKFKNVFTDGSLKKWEKAQLIQTGEYTGEQAYVAKCQLETILQKMMLARIAAAVALNDGDLVEVSETRGVGLLQIHFSELAFEANGHLFNMGMQFQGKSIKINLMAAEYAKSRAEWIPETIHSNVMREADKLGLRFNPPRANAYLSMSKSLTSSLWKYPFDEIVDVVKMELVTARKVCSDLRASIMAN